MFDVMVQQLNGGLPTSKAFAITPLRSLSTLREGNQWSIWAKRVLAGCTSATPSSEVLFPAL